MADERAMALVGMVLSAAIICWACHFFPHPIFLDIVMSRVARPVPVYCEARKMPIKENVVWGKTRKTNKIYKNRLL